MSWQSVRLHRCLGDYRADWDRLNDQYYGDHPFVNSRFMEALLRYFGTGRERLFIHRSNDEIDGLIILSPRRFGVWQLFVPSQLQAVPLLIPRAELINELFRALPRTAWAIELMNQDPDFVPPGLLDQRPCSQVLPHALTMNVSFEMDFDAYWEGRSRKLVQNIRRYSRRAVQAHGSAALQVLTEPESMPDAIRRYGELESRGWKRELGTELSIDNEQGRFYVELMSRFAETGQARVFEYRFGDQLVASRLAIDNGRMLLMLKTTYDEDLSSLAPGRLLLHSVLERAFAEKRYKFVEFYTNATQDQLAWATGQRVISHVTCFRRPWQTALYKIYQRLKVRSNAGLGDPGPVARPS
jgi:hypothetical protein